MSNKRNEISPLVKSLSGVIRLPEDLDYKDILASTIEFKYWIANAEASPTVSLKEANQNGRFKEKNFRKMPTKVFLPTHCKILMK